MGQHFTAAQVGGRWVAGSEVRSPMVVTVYGVIAVSFMMTMYALEKRGARFVLLFAIGCVLSSSYGFLSGAWPFGVVELVWSVIAVQRYRAAQAAAGRVASAHRGAGVDEPGEVRDPL